MPRHPLRVSGHVCTMIRMIKVSRSMIKVSRSTIKVADDQGRMIIADRKFADRGRARRRGADHGARPAAGGPDHARVAAFGHSCAART